VIKGDGKGGVVAFTEIKVRKIIAVPINNSRSFMGRTSYQKLKEYHPGYWLAGDRALEMFEKIPGKSRLPPLAVWSAWQVSTGSVRLFNYPDLTQRVIRRDLFGRSAFVTDRQALVTSGLKLMTKLTQM
jgi:hypothetical protein